MRTVTAAYLQETARSTFRPRWAFRIVDQDGNRYTIPGTAVLDRQRVGAINGGTWRLSLTCLTAQLPKGIRPQQYHRIEVSRIVAGMPYSYFVGIIDKEGLERQLEAGAVIGQLQIDAFGVLQRAKGYRINSLRVDPAVFSGMVQLSGICSTRRYRPNTAISAGGAESLINGAGPYNPAAGGIQIFSGGTLDAPTGPYTRGTSSSGDFWIDTSTFPVTIRWRVVPATGRIIEFQSVERFIAPVTGYVSGGSRYAQASWIVLPYGRSYDDLFHTYVEDWDDADPHNLRIRLADSTGWRDLFGAQGGEYAAIVTADGVTHFKQVAIAADADGWITIASGETLPPGIQEGDPIRLATSEGFSAWDDDRLVHFYKGASGGLEWNRRYFVSHPNLGLAVPIARNWMPTERVSAWVAFIREDVDDNRIENVIKRVLTTASGLFSPSDVIAEPTGVYVKNRTWFAMDLSDVLAEAKDQAFAPNAYINDTPDGKVTIKPYQQKPVADWELLKVQRIEEVEEPEPVTAVTVISEDQEVNVAPEWFKGSENITNPERVVDGIKTGLTTGVPAGYEWTYSLLQFSIPEPVPIQAHPMISKLRIHGAGLVTVYVTRGSSSYYLSGYTHRPIESGFLEIDGADLARILTADAHTLTIRFDPITAGDGVDGAIQTAKACAEIEILTKQAGAWRAALTDDTSRAPANNGPDQFGTIWRQPDPTKRESFRYAPPDYLKRVQVLYPNKARDEVLTMVGISQQDTRDYAERYEDEFLRAGKTYKVVAPFDDRAELGDTVSVRMLDGTKRNLLLWGMSDGGGPGDVLCNYDFIDYGR